MYGCLEDGSRRPLRRTAGSNITIAQRGGRHPRTKLGRGREASWRISRITVNRQQGARFESVVGHDRALWGSKTGKTGRKIGQTAPDTVPPCPLARACQAQFSCACFWHFPHLTRSDRVNRHDCARCSFLRFCMKRHVFSGMQLM